MVKRKLRNTKSLSELKCEIKTENFSRKTLSFYKYVEIKNPQKVRDKLFLKLNNLNCKGRIYIAKEGINAQMNVPEKKFLEFDKFIKSISEFSDIPYKIAVEENKKSSFLKLIIKVKRKIVADGIDEENFDPSDTGKYFSASDVNEHIKKGGVVIDMRNFYEARVGRFRDAQVMKVKTFRQQLKKVESQFQDKKDEKILLYCTGGIRCEKASAWMKFQGFKNVFHIKGGIIDYTHQVKKQGLKNYFLGKNFVFDERMGEKISEDIISDCDICKKTKSDNYYNCKRSKCSKLFLACDNCLKKRKNFCSLKCQILEKIKKLFF